MDEKFLVGVIAGMVGGAVIVANSQKAKSVVLDGQNQLSEKVKSLTKKQNSKKS